MQDPSPQGPANTTAPYIEDHTPSDDHAAYRGWQDDRRNLRRTKDDIQDDCDARRLPTVYFLQCKTTVPRDSGENDDFRAPTLLYAAPSL